MSSSSSSEGAILALDKYEESSDNEESRRTEHFIQSAAAASDFPSYKNSSDEAEDRMIGLLNSSQHARKSKSMHSGFVIEHKLEYNDGNVRSDIRQNYDPEAYKRVAREVDPSMSLLNKDLTHT